MAMELLKSDSCFVGFCFGVAQMLIYQRPLESSEKVPAPALAIADLAMGIRDA